MRRSAWPQSCLAAHPNSTQAQAGRLFLMLVVMSNLSKAAWIRSFCKKSVDARFAAAIWGSKSFTVFQEPEM